MCTLRNGAYFVQVRPIHTVVDQIIIGAALGARVSLTAAKLNVPAEDVPVQRFGEACSSWGISLSKALETGKDMPETD